LYNIFYVLPLLAIVLTFSYTLGAKKLSQEQGEALKLVSGVMMLSLGSVLVFNPGLLNNVISTIFLMFGAIFITGLILFIRKRINESKEF
jgi:uncharacterized membrane protein HdeD (DUF308 family)